MAAAAAGFQQGMKPFARGATGNSGAADGRSVEKERKTFAVFMTKGKEEKETTLYCVGMKRNAFLSRNQRALQKREDKTDVAA